MKVHVFVGGDPGRDASTFYRLKLPVDVLRSQGYDVELMDEVPEVTWERGLLRNRVVDWTPTADVVVFQRPVVRDFVDLIEVAARRCTVIVDLDDDFFAIPRDNVAYKAFDPANHPDRNWDQLRRALALCHGVTVTTDALARRYGRHRTLVLPNYVPSTYLEHVHTDPGRRLTWTGTTLTHPHDLESTKGAVGRAIEETGAELFVVGDGAGVRQALNADFAQFEATGWVSLEEYPLRMSQSRVGIVPLHSSAFNHGKSWLKGMEFAAVGVPFIASNTQPYVALEKLGIGEVARTPREWYERTHHLLCSPHEAMELGYRYRERVRHELTIESNAWRWWKAWSRIHAGRRGA